MTDHSAMDMGQWSVGRSDGPSLLIHPSGSRPRVRFETVAQQMRVNGVGVGLGGRGGCGVDGVG